jgi:3-phenylpropionate/trans-cinnamate dioxygenase ferredoxin component
MSDWVKVIQQSALAKGEHIIVDVDGIDVAVFNIDGSFYAIEDVCSHDGAPIADGLLDGDEIICPRHGARFCVKTGAVKAPPAYEDIPCFKVKIEDGLVQVKDERWD